MWGAVRPGCSSGVRLPASASAYSIYVQKNEPIH